MGNPVCEHPEATENYCTVPQANSSYTRLPEKCVPLHCISDQISSPNCKCSYPYRGVLVYKPPFLESRNLTYYVHLEEESLMRSFKFHQLPVDSVDVNFPAKDSFGYLESNLSMFPSGQNHFNTATISDIGFVLTLQTYENSDIFGPTYFKGSAYPYFDGTYTFHAQVRDWFALFFLSSDDTSSSLPPSLSCRKTHGLKRVIKHWKDHWGCGWRSLFPATIASCRGMCLSSEEQKRKSQ